jgi:putative FmdB family regulatory protein
MPLYEFTCDCGKITEKFMKMQSVKSKVMCSCGKWAKRVFSAPMCITDTSFQLTGTFDKRLGSKIEGRKDFYRKVEAKGYVPLSDHQFKNME